MVGTLYVGQKEDLNGCVHAMLDRLASQEYLRNGDAMTTLPNWQVNCGYPQGLGWGPKRTLQYEPDMCTTQYRLQLPTP